MDKKPACCPLLAEGCTNKIKANYDIRSRRFYRSSPYLPVFGNVARVDLWGGSRFEATGGDLERFLTGGPRDITFRSEVQATRMYCGQSLYSPQPGWFEYAMPGYGSWRVNRCQGAPRSEELDCKELHGAAGSHLELRESAVSAHCQHVQPTFHHLQVWYNVDFKGVKV